MLIFRLLGHLRASTTIKLVQKYFYYYYSHFFPFLDHSKMCMHSRVTSTDIFILQKGQRNIRILEGPFGVYPTLILSLILALMS